MRIATHQYETLYTKYTLFVCLFGAVQIYIQAYAGSGFTFRIFDPSQSDMRLEPFGFGRKTVDAQALIQILHEARQFRNASSRA